MRAFLIAVLALARLAPVASADDPAQHPPTGVKHYQYFDWTKGGNGPWSDVYYRHDHKVVIGAIFNG